MLTNEDKIYLLNLAREAEAESYNVYFMQGITKILYKYAEIYGSRMLWEFLINESEITYKLYLEFCLLNSPILKDNISFRVA